MVYIAQLLTKREQNVECLPVNECNVKVAKENNKNQVSRAKINEMLRYFRVNEKSQGS